MDFVLLGIGALGGLGLGLVLARRDVGPTSPVPKVLVSAEEPPATRDGLFDVRLLDFVGDRLIDPLSEMVESAEMLQEDAVLLEQNDFVPDLLKIRATARQVLALLEDLYDLAKLDEGRVQPANDEVFVRPLVESVQADVQALLHRTLATLSVQVDDDVPLIHSDERRLRRALVNLVVQAVSMTAQGDLHLRARVEGEVAIFELDHPSLELDAESLRVMTRDLGAAEGEAVYTANDVGLGWVLTGTVARWLQGRFVILPDGMGTRFQLHVPVGQGR